MIGRISWSLAILGLWALRCGQAEAGFIPLGALVGPARSEAGTGLNGAFYDGGAATALLSISAANAIIAAGGPTATFHSSLVDYPGGATAAIADTTPLGTYLGSDAAS